MITLNPPSKLEESTLQAKSLILRGLTLMKKEPNIGIKFLPCAATRMNWRRTRVHYMRRIVSFENVEKTSTVSPFYQNKLWNSCLLESCLRQQEKLLQGVEKYFQQTMSMPFFVCSTSKMNSCTYCWFSNWIITAVLPWLSLFSQRCYRYVCKCTL